jgi:hypothetical protein
MRVVAFQVKRSLPEVKPERGLNSNGFRIQSNLEALNESVGGLVASAR